MESVGYVGMDVHKDTIDCVVMDDSSSESRLRACRTDHCTAWGAMKEYMAISAFFRIIFRCLDFPA